MTSFHAILGMENMIIVIIFFVRFDSTQSSEEIANVEKSIINELETLKGNLKLRESILRV